MRRLVNCTPILAVGLGVLLDQLRQRRYFYRVLQGLIILLVVWTLLLVVEIGQRSWLDPEYRSFGFYTAALKLTSMLVVEPWLLWKLGVSYLPTLIYGVFRRDTIMLQSAILLMIVTSFVPWLGLIAKRVRIGTALLVMIGVVAVVDGFILASAWNTRELYALDLARSPAPSLYTRLREGERYEGLLVQGVLNIAGKQVVEIAGRSLEANGLEMLWSWEGVSSEGAIVEMVISDREGLEAGRFLLETDAFSPPQAVQVQRWLEPHPTPMHVPYWLFPERFTLRQVLLYPTQLEFDHPVALGGIRFRLLAGEGNWQVHSLSWIPTQQ